MLNNYILRLKSEFKGYNSQKLVKDILAGLTVAAVALPLALAFGVSSGADAGVQRDAIPLCQRCRKWRTFC